MPFNITSSNEAQIAVTSAPVTASGRAAKVDGPLRVTVQSGTSTFTQDPASPLAFTAVSGDVADTTVYLVEADADLGSGVTLISDTVIYAVNLAVAAGLGFSAGAASPKP